MREHEKRRNESIVSFGSYRLDVGNIQLWRGVQEVKITGKAFAVLRYFVEHPGQLATKDDLFAAAWPETVVSEATLVSGIQELRQALRDDAKKPRYIETVHRRGYRFISEVVSSQEAVDRRQEQERESNEQGRGSVALSTAAPQALPLPDKPSIIVLPLVNLSGDPEREYFSDGPTEVLTGDLSQIAGLFVIAHNSAFTYKGKVVKVQEVGREMGVRYVLEGSVQKDKDTVRITAQLIDAIQGQHLWSERYDRLLTDIFALQDELVQKIVTTLNLQISLQEQGDFPVHRTTANLEAYDAFLQGAGYFVRLAIDTNPQARQMFEHALALDPQYALAYAFLGWTYYLEWLYQWNPDPRNVERAEDLVRQALALNERLPMAHGLLSHVYWQQEQPELALAAAEQAVIVAPNFAEAYIWRAQRLLAVDRPVEALRDVEQAMRLNPRYPFWYPDNLGLAYRLLGRSEEAIAAHQQVLLRNPQYQFAYVFLTLSYAEAWLWQQRQDPQTPAQALEAARRAVALNASSSSAHVALGWAALLDKHYAQTEAEIEQASCSVPGVLTSTLAQRRF